MKKRESKKTGSERLRDKNRDKETQTETHKTYRLRMIKTDYKYFSWLLALSILSNPWDREYISIFCITYLQSFKTLAMEKIIRNTA